MTTGTRKVFLLGFNPPSLDRGELIAFLDKDPFFLNWITLLPGQIFVVAESNVRDVTLKIRRAFPGQLIFVTEVLPESSDGWLPKNIWQFVGNPSNARVGNVPELVSK